MDDLEVIEKKDADTVIICSSELIASVMQEYFNKKMFKIAVEIVDLQSTESGYAFSLLFKSKEETSKLKEIDYSTLYEQTPHIAFPRISSATIDIPKSRDNKGKFAKSKKKEEMIVYTDD